MINATKINLFENYFLQEVDYETFQPIFKKHELTVFPTRREPNPNKPAYTAEDIANFHALGDIISNALKLYFLIFCGEEVIGWHFGNQTERWEFYMINTGILPAFQNKGIYTAVLPHLLKAIQDKGFWVITSMHHISNNAVIVPKLKAGFFIESVGLDYRFGTMTKLIYFYFDEHKQDFLVRSGWKLK